MVVGSGVGVIVMLTSVTWLFALVWIVMLALSNPVGVPS